MFKFDFDFDNEAGIISDDEQLNPDDETVSDSDNKPPTSVEIPLSHLIDALPAVISYSPLSIPLSSRSEPLCLARRDLFDARFQLISEGRDLQFFETPSDLVPGVYEGGLKTWECSLDLVDYMESHELAMVGKKVLEVGCGTAVPSMYLLHRTLSFLPETNCPPETQLHLQDYNSSVLELVTLPNLLITWYLSPASGSYHSERPVPYMPSEISITADLKSAFLSSLQQYHISLRFFSGPWEKFNPQQYDIVLTSETIYRMASLPSLVHLLHTACLGTRSGNWSSENDEDCMWSPSLCLVAAKVVYFGVGGGVAEFTKIVEGDESKEKRGRVQTVWETKTGVKRRVLSVTWAALGGLCDTDS